MNHFEAFPKSKHFEPTFLRLNVVAFPLLQKDEASRIVANWTSNTEFELNGGKFICLENAHSVSTNAVVLNVSLAVRHGSVARVEEGGNRCIVHNDMTVHIESLNALICPANQISNVESQGNGNGNGVRSVHTIIEQRALRCNVSGEDRIALRTQIAESRDYEVNGQFDKLDFTISFIDMQIFQNIAESINTTFNPHNATPLEERIASLVPMELSLRDKFAKLRTQGFPAELCFEALMHFKYVFE